MSRNLRGRNSWKDKPVRELSVLLEDYTFEADEEAVFSTTYYLFRVLCHERPCGGDGRNGCKEYLWRIRRRYSDFAELEGSLREADMLPTGVTMPRKTYWRHLVPSNSFAIERGCQLLSFLRQVMSWAAAAAQAESQDCFLFGAGKARSTQCDLTDISDELARFLGLEEQKGPCDWKDEEVHRSLKKNWALPHDAEQRSAVLVHSFESGVYIAGQRDPGPTTVRLRRVDKQAPLGDMMCLFAEARQVAPRSTSADKSRRSSSVIRFSATLSGPTSPIPEDYSLSKPATPSSGWSTPRPLSSQACPPSWLRSPPSSMGSTPSASRLQSPACSPPQSRCQSPSRQRAGSSPMVMGKSASLASMSTASTSDAEHGWRTVVREAPRLQPGVWIEVDVESEYQRMWAASAQAGKIRGEQLGRAGRAKFTARLERTAALFRELATISEDLHQILGYGSDGSRFVVVQAESSAKGMRQVDFNLQRCQQMLRQSLQALDRVHSQGLPHGFLSPESFLIEENHFGDLVLQLIWAPGQLRPEGHITATLGFRCPVAHRNDEGPGAAEDIWALACVVLVWWKNFRPVPHPWTQFAGCPSLSRELAAAFEQQPPELPQALLDMHAAAAASQDPEASVMQTLASLLTRCLVLDPSARPTAQVLLKDKFFDPIDSMLDDLNECQLIL